MRSTSSRTRGGSELLVRTAVTVVLIGGSLAAILSVPGIPYDWAGVWRDGDGMSEMLTGLGMTFLVSMGALVLAIVLGVVVGLMRMSRNVIWNQVGTVYVEVIRGTPLYVQIMVAYFCVAVAVRRVLTETGTTATLVDLTQNATAWGIVVLGVFAGAYVAEIVRAAIQSVDPGQTEAALSQGMTKRQVFRYVLFPQALRRMIPPLTGQFVSLVKDSSLLSLVSVAELMYRAERLRSATYTTFEVLIPLAFLYLAITFPLSMLARRLEVRLT